MSDRHGQADERSNLEKLDDLQAAYPFRYNLVVGALVGALVLLPIGVQPALVAVYVLVYASLRWFLWQDGRLLHRQYVARASRWAAKRDARRRAR